MADFRDDNGIPGSWGEYFVTITNLSVMMESGKYSNYEQLLSSLTELETYVNTKYDAVSRAITNHINHKSNSDHNLTKQDIGMGLVDNNPTATASQIDSSYNDYYSSAATAQYYGTQKPILTGGADIHKQNVNPISVYGDKTWIPVNITQTYPGSMLTASDSQEYAMIQDDSTYVGIAHTTNGVTEGMFMNKLLDAARRVDEMTPVDTQQPFILNGIEGDITNVVNGDSGCVVGVLANGSHGAFISLIYSDLNPKNHTTCYLDIDDANFGGPFGTTCVAGDYVYIFTSSYAPGNNTKQSTTPFEITCYRVAKKDIVQGGTVTATELTNWKSTGLWADTPYTGTKIRLAGSLTSDDKTQQPFILHKNESWLYEIDPGNCNTRMLASVNPNNPNQIRLGIHSLAKANTKSGMSVEGFMAFSMLLTIGTTNTAVVEDDVNYITLTTTSIDSIKMTSKGFVNPSNVIGHDGVDGWTNITFSNDGHFFNRSCGLIPNTDRRFIKGKVVGWVDRYTALRYQQLQLKTLYDLPIAVTTQNIIRGNLGNPAFIGRADCLIVNMMGHPSGDAAQMIHQKTNLERNKITIPTAHSGDLQGWEGGYPIREYDNLSFNQKVIMTRCNMTVDSHASDASVMYRGGTPTGTTIALATTDSGSTLEISGNFTYDPDEADRVVLDAIKTITGYTEIFRYDWVIYVPQNTSTPLTAVCGYTVKTSTGYSGGHILFELNYSGSRGGNCTGYTYGTLCKHVTYSYCGRGVWLNPDVMGGHTRINTATEDYLCAIGCPVVIEGINTVKTGSAKGLRRDIGIIFFAVVRAYTRNTYEKSSIKYLTHDTYIGGETPSGCASRAIDGLCIVDYKTNNLNNNTILAVTKMAGTYEEFLAWTPLATYVIANQWEDPKYVYTLCCDEPVFMAGKQYTLSPYTFNLADITSSPPGKTFYIGVAIINAVPQYNITLVPAETTIGQMPIGEIALDGAGVSTITIRKPMRVDIYELSAPRVGTAIPITVGSAQEKGDFYWINPAFNGISLKYVDTSGTEHTDASTIYDIAYVLVTFDLNEALSNVKLTVEENNASDQGIAVYQVNGGTWGALNASNTIATVNPGDSIRINVSVTEDYSTTKRWTANLHLTLDFSDETRHTATTEIIGYQLNNITPAVIVRFIMQGVLPVGASARLKCVGPGGNYNNTLMAVIQGGAYYPDGACPNGVEVYCHQTYDNVTGEHFVSPFPGGQGISDAAVFTRAGTLSPTNITKTALMVENGDYMYARIVAQPTNKSPWIENGGPSIELINQTDVDVSFRLQVGDYIGSGVLDTTEEFNVWTLEHTTPVPPPEPDPDPVQPDEGTVHVNDRSMFNFNVIIDVFGEVSVNFRTGRITVSVDNDHRSYTNTLVMTSPEYVWSPGIIGEFRNDNDHDFCYVEAIGQFGEVDVDNLAAAKSSSLRLGEITTRETLEITQQPTIENDFTAKVRYTDGDPGGEYTNAATLYFTASSDHGSYGDLDNVVVLCDSVSRGSDLGDATDTTWNFTIHNNNQHALDGIQVVCRYVDVASGNNFSTFTMSTANAPETENLKYSVVNGVSSSVSLSGRGSQGLTRYLYGNRFVYNDREIMCQYDTDVFFVVSLTYNGITRHYSKLGNYRLTYVLSGEEISLRLRRYNDCQGDDWSHRGAVWHIEASAYGGTIQGATITCEYLYVAGGQMRTLTFTPWIENEEDADTVKLYVEHKKTYTLDLTSLPYHMTCRMWGNVTWDGDVDIDYNGTVSMKVTVTGGGINQTFTLPYRHCQS